MSWPFFVRHYDDRRPAGAGREVPARAGRRPLPAVGHPRRLHRAQRDDHRLPARRRLGRHRRRHRRPELAVDGDAPVVRAARGVPLQAPSADAAPAPVAGPPAGRAAVRQRQVRQPQPARLRRLAAHHPRRPRARPRRQAGHLGDQVRRGAQPRGLPAASADPVRGAGQRGRPQRLAGPHPPRGAVADPDRRAEGPAQRCPGTDPGRRRAASRPARGAHRRAGHPGAVRRPAGRRPGRRRRRVPGPAARLPGRPGGRRRRPAGTGPGAGPPRGHPRRRRVQHPPAAEALRHRARGPSSTGSASRAAATCRASGRTCRTATRSASSPGCGRTSRCSRA